MAKGYLYDNGDELISREDVNEVPDSSSAHAGDVLSLDSDKKPKWSTPESELPSTGTASVGDVLTLDSDKDPVWSAPSGGGGLTVLQMFVHENQGVPDYVSIMDPNTPGGFLTYSELLEIAQDNQIYYILDVSSGKFPGSVNHAICGDFGEVTDVFATSFVYSGASVSIISVINTGCTDNQTDFSVNVN